MRGVHKVSRLGQQHEILNPSIFASRSIAAQHISENLNVFTAGNHRSRVQAMRLILQQRRPVKNEVVTCSPANRSEIREVRLTRRGGNVYGSKDWHASDDSDQHQRANAVRSRDSRLLLYFRSTAHPVNLNAQNNSGKRISDKWPDVRHERSTRLNQRKLFQNGDSELPGRPLMTQASPLTSDFHPQVRFV